MVRRALILLCILCFNISSLHASEKDKTITFAVGHDHDKMLMKSRRGQILTSDIKNR